MMIALGQHTRAGIEENLWDTIPGKRLTSVQQIEKHVRMAKELGRKIATTDEARQILGFDPKVELADAIARTVKWYRAHGGRPVRG